LLTDNLVDQEIVYISSCRWIRYVCQNWAGEGRKSTSLAVRRLL